MHLTEYTYIYYQNHATGRSVIRQSVKQLCCVYVTTPKSYVYRICVCVLYYVGCPSSPPPPPAILFDGKERTK